MAGVSLTLAKGGITGLIGPNGAGKTTLFNILAGALAADRGQISFDSVDITALPPDRRFQLGLARTFQIARPFGEMTVLENLLLAPSGQSGERFWNGWLRPAAIALEERANIARAREVLEFTTLAGQAGAPARTLSGGQQKLLELARILMTSPKLILLDEPAAGVNPELIELIMRRIEALNARGLTFLIIEHNMDVITRLCGRVLVMAEGRLIADGTPAQVKADALVGDAYLGGGA